jgi:hypothetical protein
MTKGEVCVLTCSPDYAYGGQEAVGPIPANSTLEFEVELIGWKEKGEDEISYMTIFILGLFGLMWYFYRNKQ